MYQGAHIRKGRPKRKVRYRVNKTLFALLAIVMVIGAVVGTTVAFLITNTGPVENKFAYASVSCAVEEKFDGSRKEKVQIKNTGSTDAYIRATYVVNWVDAQGNIVASVPKDYHYKLEENPDSKWTEGNDGYFYYLSPVAPGEFTPGSLLTCTVTRPENPEYRLSVEILATAIQSTPAKAVTEAWGVTPASGN
jgi:predicted amidohydrolase